MGRAPASGCCRRSCRRRTRGGEAATAGRFWVRAKYSYPLWLDVVGAPCQDTPDGGTLVDLRCIACLEAAGRLQFRGSNCSVQIRFRHAIQSDGRSKLSDRASRGRQLRRRGRQARGASPNCRRLRIGGRGTRLDRTGQAAVECRRPIPDAHQPEVARVLMAPPGRGVFNIRQSDRSEPDHYPAEGACAASTSRECTSSSNRRRAETAISSRDGV